MIRNAYSINKLLKDPKELAMLAQVGIDLTVKSIAVIGSGASIPRTGKTVHANQKDLILGEGGSFYLIAGQAYAITFDQGLEELPSNKCAFIKQRSSLNRNGCLVTGSVFDPGYGCDNLGATMYPTQDIIIEQHARVAQLLIHDTEEASLYDGQYKGE